MESFRRAEFGLEGEESDFSRKIVHSKCIRRFFLLICPIFLISASLLYISRSGYTIDNKGNPQLVAIQELEHVMNRKFEDLADSRSKLLNLIDELQTRLQTMNEGQQIITSKILDSNNVNTVLKSRDEDIKKIILATFGGNDLQTFLKSLNDEQNTFILEALKEHQHKAEQLIQRKKSPLIFDIHKNVFDLNLDENGEDKIDCASESKIPYNHILFTIPNKWNYLRAVWANDMDSFMNVVDDENFNSGLFTNVVKTIKIHKHNNPCLKVFMYNDNDCLSLVNEIYPQAQDIFLNDIEYGPYRSDICRALMLYKYGGLYVDVDLQPVVNILDYISSKNVDFSSSLMGNGHEFFQAILYSVPKADLLIRYVELCLKWLSIPEATRPANIGGLMGVWAIGKAYETINEERELQGLPGISSLLLKEVSMSREDFDAKKYSNAFWQDGEGGFCNYVNINPNTNEIVAYSRFVGFKQWCGKVASGHNDYHKLKDDKKNG